MNCSWINENVHTVLDGDLPPDQERAVQEHVDACPACSALLDGVRSQEQLLRSVLPRPAAPPGLATDVTAAVRRSQAGRRPGWTLSTCMRVAAGIAAAVAVVGVCWRLLVPPPAPAPDPFPGVAAARAEEARSEPSPEGELTAPAPLSVGDYADVLLDAQSTCHPETGGIRLDSGRVFCDVRKGGEGSRVRTPHATATVRGTRFVVDARSPHTTVLTVLEGVVEFSTDAGTTQVAANMQSEACLGEPPAPALPVDVLDAVSWAGVDEADLGVAFDVALSVLGPEYADGSASLLADVDYRGNAFAGLTLYCRIRDADDGLRHTSRHSLCGRTIRYTTRRIALPAFPPGQYSAEVRIGHGERATMQTLRFVVP